VDEADPDETEVDGAEQRQATAPLGQEDPPPASPAFRSEGGTLGRYALLSRIGHGGMGEVHLAYDPQLKREVALKLVRPHRSDPAEQARLLREAQAMAQLNHPNVAAVYDAGEVEGQVFIAMEYIDGCTLAEWLSTHKPDHRGILDIFIGAGQGLAAAHAVGLIHRDFKPTNVIVGTDGRPRVLDFGLARLVTQDGDVDKTVEDDLTRSSELDSLATPLTEAGTVMGTPAYMAPEQHYAGQPTPAWDVYAFCVALYEALYHRRPFSGVGVREMAKAKRQGIPATAPSSASVPSWIFGVVRSGLEAHPSKRIASMDLLLERLGSDPSRRRRRLRARLITGGVGALIATGIGFAVSATSNPCSAAADHIEEVWDAKREAILLDAFERTELSYAASAWARVKQETDAFVTEWSAAQIRACEATHVRHEQSERVLDLRTQCLRRSEQELAALLDVLSSADAGVVERAHLAVVSLSDPTRCDDVDALASGIDPPDPASRAAVEGVRAELLKLAALDAAGRYEDVIIRAEEAVTAAEDTHYDPVVAEALRWRGRFHERDGDYAEAIADLEAAYFLASELRHDELAWEAALDLAEVIGLTRAELDVGRRWARQAKAALGRGRAGSVEEAETLLLIGDLDRARGEFDDAKVSLERALDIYLERLGPGDRRVADVVESLGSVAEGVGRFTEAEAHYRRSIEILEASLGEEHPAVSRAMGGLGSALTEQKKFEEAESLIREALARQERIFGEGDPAQAPYFASLGLLKYKMQSTEEAIEHLSKALAMTEQIHGPNHPEVATLLSNLSACQQRLGRHEEVLRILKRVLPIREEALGPDHIDVALAYTNVGVAYFRLDRFEEALPYYETALEIGLRGVGPNHFRMARIHRGLGNALVAVGRSDEAAPHFNRALVVATANEPDADRLAYIKWGLAQVTWDAGIEPDRAIRLAEEARATWVENKTTTQTVDAWLAERRPKQ
jgi:tetratricopeptide (TPR) repeat protein/predicted Ser/Thr protein kinase